MRHCARFFKSFVFCIGVQLINNVVIVSGGQQRDSAIHIYMYSFSPKLSSHPGCHITVNKVPWLCSRTLFVFHFKYSSVCMSIRNSSFSSATYICSLSLYFCFGNVAVKRKKKRNEFFSFSFPRTKKIKRTVSRTEHS